MQNWRLKANCLGMDTELFYPPRDKTLYREVADNAKRICRAPQCPVRAECLTFAIQHQEKYGIWGGYSHRERNALVRKAARLGVEIVSLIK